MKEIKILVCQHKETKLFHDDVYTPIQVGKAKSKVDLGILGDDEGDNISAKNDSYCELTALYWAWKNMKGVDYIGLSHYRRYFNLETKSLKFTQLVSEKALEFMSYRRDRYITLMKEYDIIMSKPKYFGYSIECQYALAHSSCDLKTIKNIIHELYPQYDHSYYEVIENGNKLRPFNMFFSSWNLFSEYCEWLFNILFEAERRIDISK